MDPGAGSLLDRPSGSGGDDIAGPAAAAAAMASLPVATPVSRSAGGTAGGGAGAGAGAGSSGGSNDLRHLSGERLLGVVIGLFSWLGGRVGVCVEGTGGMLWWWRRRRRVSKRERRVRELWQK